MALSVFSGAGVGLPSSVYPKHMTLTSTDFQPIIDALSASAPVLIGFLISMGAVAFIIAWVKSEAGEEALMREVRSRHESLLDILRK